MGEGRRESEREERGVEWSTGVCSDFGQGEIRCRKK
jgi:hypothetical protein